MSRAYEAREIVLNVCKEDRATGVDLFLGYLDCSEGDFNYEQGESAEEYIYGKKERV